MKIQYAADLHLELAGNSKYVKEIPFEVTGDVLVLAGDTAYLRDKNLPNSKFWEWVSENYREVFLVPGNHEYYGFGDVLENGDSWSREILPNVHYHQNRVIRVDDTDFILSTLWSRINPANEFTIWQGMNDFYQIRYGGKNFLPGHFNDEHEKCLAFIKKSVAESDAKHIVVVTHHLPTMAVVAPHHKRSPLNTAFAVDLAADGAAAQHGQCHVAVAAGGRCPVLRLVPGDSDEPLGVGVDPGLPADAGPYCSGGVLRRLRLRLDPGGCPADGRW